MLGDQAVVAGAGTDIVDIDRLRAFVARRGEAAVDRLLTEFERGTVRGRRGIRWGTFAGHVAAKEATKKVLGSRGETARWSEIEVYHGLHGEPYLRLTGETLLAARRHRIHGLILSISHEKNLAIAVVVATTAAQPWETEWTHAMYSSRSSAS